MTITLTREQWRTVHRHAGHTAMHMIQRQCKAADDDTITVELPLAYVWTWADTLPEEIRAVFQTAMDIERIHQAFRRAA